MMCRLLFKQRCAKDSLLSFKRREEPLKNRYRFFTSGVKINSTVYSICFGPLSCQNNYRSTVREVAIMANKILSSSYDTP